MSAKEFGDIDYETVPSKANLLYNDAFLKRDEIRRREFLSKLEKGEVKINSSVLFPHEIYHKYINNTRDDSGRIATDAALEAMWKSLPNYVSGNRQTLAIVDGSGSMEIRVGKSNVEAIEISRALGIYFAERCEGQFKNKFITFSDNPQLIELNRDSLIEKIQLISRHSDCPASTNIEATFDLLLDVANKNHLSQEDIPDLLIMSDMEFDTAVKSRSYTYINGWRTNNENTEKLFETIANKWEIHGYKLPKLSFWNLASRTNTIPVIENELGVSLISGYSPATLNIALGESYDPYKALVDVLNSDRYSQVTLNK
jgi:hypothetical protein